jgi:hypothetical protein
MGLAIKLYNISQKNEYTISYKEGDTPYPIDSGYTHINRYQPSTTQIVLSSVMFSFDTKYWIKITDTKTQKFIIKSIYMNDAIAFQECGASCDLTGIVYLLNNDNYIKIKLIIAGANTGPFDIFYSNDNGVNFLPFTEFQDITKAAIILGQVIENTYNITTNSIVKIESKNECKNSIDIIPIIGEEYLPPEE